MIKLPLSTRNVYKNIKTGNLVLVKFPMDFAMLIVTSYPDSQFYNLCTFDDFIKEYTTVFTPEKES